MKTDSHLVLQLMPEYGPDGELTAASRRLQDLMRSDDVVELVTLPWAPSVHRDPTYTDLVVVWDHGEGPHNPVCDDDEWRRHHCLPAEVWDYVTEIVEAHGRQDEYLWIWLRSEEAHSHDDLPSTTTDLGDATLAVLRSTLDELSRNRNSGVEERARRQSIADALAQRVRHLAIQINDITAMMFRTAWPDLKHDPVFGDVSLRRIGGYSSKEIYASTDGGAIALPYLRRTAMSEPVTHHPIRIHIAEDGQTTIKITRWPAEDGDRSYPPGDTPRHTFSTLAEYVESLHAAIKLRR
jgi:hypothetical protein